MRPYILLLFLLSFFCARGKEPALNKIRFSALTVNEGLAHNNVNTVTQDQKGFVWIGTRNGLCRYDGDEIRPYQYDDTDTTSLIHNYVLKVLCDSKDRLWVCTEGGICRYDHSMDNFVRYPLLKNQRAGTVVELRDGTILAVIQGVFCRYDEQKDRFDPLRIEGYQPYRAYDVLEDRNGLLWVASGGGLSCVDYKARKALPELPAGCESGLSSSHITSLATDDQGKIYIGTHYGGLRIFDPARRETVRIDTGNGLRSNVVRSLLNTGDGNMWAGTELGIGIVNISSLRVSNLIHDRFDASGLNDNAIYSIYQDNSGNVWVGTFFGGVNVFFSNWSRFTCYSYGYSDRHLSGKAIREIRPEKNGNRLWIATEDGGLNLYDRGSGRFDHYTDRSSAVPVSYHNVHSVLTDSNGEVWISTFTGGVNRYNPKTRRMRYYSNMDVPLDMTICSLEDQWRGHIYFGTTNGLVIYQPERDRFVNVTDPLIYNRHMYCFLQDKNGKLWIGTRNDGLLLYDPDSGKAHQIALEGNFTSFVTCLYQDNLDNIWIGTNNGGVIVYNQEREQDQQQRFTTQDGLPSNSIMSIIQDADYNIWISTINGLCRFGYPVGDRTVYNTGDGLPTNQFNYSSSYLAPDGELFFGTVNGMISFFPEQLESDPRNLKVCFTKLMIEGVEARIGDKVLPCNISEATSIRLSHKQAQLVRLHFTAFDFSHSKVTYAMKLDDSPWQELGTQSSVLFSKLPMGNHRISIRASSDGVRWDEEGAGSIEIRVAPPFMLSWMAWCIYALVLFGLGFVVYKLLNIKLSYIKTVERERLEKNNLQELNRKKIDFFTNISHELKTPLTLILSPLNMMASDDALPSGYHKKLNVVAKNAQRMLFIIDELITFSKIEMGQRKVELQHGPVLPFIEEMCNIFPIVANENNIRFVVDIKRDGEKMVWFSPRVLEKIIYNILSNAFKFTPPGGSIMIRAWVSDLQRLHISISDSGIGISEEMIDRIFDNYFQVNPRNGAQGSGIGLTFAKRLVELHKGTISVKSTVGEGTTFDVVLCVDPRSFDQSDCSPVSMDIQTVSSYKYTAPAIDKFDNSALDGAGPDTDTAKILVVEDNRDLNEYICDLFREKYQVFSAVDGEEAYEQAQTLMPDLIISDVMMPRMDGFELTRRLKSEFLTCHIPVVLLTAKTTTEDTITGFDQGADVYVKKPFNAKSLQLQVNNLVATRQNNIRKFQKRISGEPEEVVSAAPNSRDEKFIDDVIGIIRSNVSNEYFSVNDIVERIGISRSMLYLKLKNLAGVSAMELIRNIRLREAKRQLEQGANVSEASYAVGISDPNYFTKCFKKQFGITPTEYIRSLECSKTNIEERLNQ